MRQWIKFHFGGGWREHAEKLTLLDYEVSEVREIDAAERKDRAALNTLAKLIEAQRVLIQNLQKEIAAGVLERNDFRTQTAGVLDLHGKELSDLKKQFAELRKHIATAEPAKLQAIRATSWGNYRKLIGEEDFDVPA